MTSRRKETAVVDTNVLINFASIDRLDLLGSLPSLDFVVPEEVRGEVLRQPQRKRLDHALETGALQTTRLEGAKTLGIFAELRDLMDLGESACLALAQHRRWIVVDDRHYGANRGSAYWSQVGIGIKAPPR